MRRIVVGLLSAIAAAGCGAVYRIGIKLYYKPATIAADRPLIRQSELMRDALTAAGVDVQFVVAPGLSHTRIVSTLSREDRPAGAAVLAFVRQHS